MKPQIEPLSPISLDASGEIHLPDASAEGETAAVTARSRGERVTEASKNSFDEDLRRRVQLFLASSNLPGLRHIDVRVDGDTVILTGQVRTFYEKQLATEFSRRVAGVFHIEDRIEVSGYAPRVDVGRTSNWRRGSLEPSFLG